MWHRLDGWLVRQLAVLWFCVCLPATSAQPTTAIRMPASEPMPASPTALRHDLDLLLTTLEQVHPNLYAYVGRQAVGAHVGRLHARLARPITRQEFFREVSTLVAGFQDGHTFVSFFPAYIAYREQGGLAFPFEVEFDGDGGATVRANYSDDAALRPGARLLSINGLETAHLQRELVALQSERLLPARRDTAAALLPRYLWYLYGFGERFEVVYTDPAVPKPQRATVQGITVGQLRTRIAAQQQTGDPASSYTYRRLPGTDIGLIDFRQCVDLAAFRQFLARTFGQIREERVGHLIVDLRANPGGEGGLGQALTDYLTDRPYSLFGGSQIKVSRQVKARYGREQYIEYYSEAAWNAPDGTLVTEPAPLTTPSPNPLRFRGSLYVLIGPRTASNGMAFASAVKDHHLGTLVGEPTGGVASGYGQTYGFELPHSHLQIQVSTKRILRPSGQDDGQGVQPDYLVLPTHGDMATGRDTVLAFTRRLIEAPSAP